MSIFTPVPVEIRAEGRKAGRLARLTSNYRIIVNKSFAGYKVGYIDIKAGFVTDFASVPRFFWRILPPWGKYCVAALAHDYLYFTGKYPKRIADLVFVELMRRLGVSGWKRRLMYWAVKWFGRRAWRKHRRAEKRK